MTADLATADVREDEALRPAKVVHLTPVSAPTAYAPWGQEMPQLHDVIELRWRSGDWDILYRPYLVGMHGTGDTLVSLLSTAGAVTIRGRHLVELRRLLKGGQVDYLQEFDPDRWPMPEENAPVIEQIQRL